MDWWILSRNFSAFSAVLPTGWKFGRRSQNKAQTKVQKWERPGKSRFSKNKQKRGRTLKCSKQTKFDTFTVKKAQKFFLLLTKNSLKDIKIGKRTIFYSQVAECSDFLLQIGALGNPVIQTPNLDRLAASSLVYTQAFTTVSSCSPSRYTEDQPYTPYFSQQVFHQ
jgi:hypothetical protein